MCFFLIYRFLKQKQNHNIVQTLFLFSTEGLEKEMATHSNILACKIPWMEEPGGLRTLHRIAKSRTRLSDYTLRAIFPKPQIRTHGLQIGQTPRRPISIHSTFAPKTLKTQEVGGGGQ